MDIAREPRAQEKIMVNLQATFGEPVRLNFYSLAPRNQAGMHQAYRPRCFKMKATDCSFFRKGVGVAKKRGANSATFGARGSGEDTGGCDT